MENFDQVSFLVSIILIVFLASITTTLLFLYIRQSKRSQYDTERNQAQLDNMRKYFESGISKMTDRLMSSETRWKDINHLLITSMQKADERVEEKRKVYLSGFLKSFGITKKDLEIEKDLVFVLTPFHPKFQQTYETILRACNKVGLRCFRGDEEFVEGNLLPHILKLIVQARLIVGNIDGRNPNVFYELGLAQALDKPTILIASSITDMPFDVSSRRIIFYKGLKELSLRFQHELTKTLIKGKN